MADIHSVKTTPCSINYVCTLKYHLLDPHKMYPLCNARDTEKSAIIFKYISVLPEYLSQWPHPHQMKFGFNGFGRTWSPRHWCCRVVDFIYCSGLAVAPFGDEY